MAASLSAISIIYNAVGLCVSMSQCKKIIFGERQADIAELIGGHWCVHFKLDAILLKSVKWLNILLVSLNSCIGLPTKLKFPTNKNDFTVGYQASKSLLYNK